MYKINTGEARTDLYGRDKGDAVWFDNQIAVKGIGEQNARNYAAQTAQATAKQKKKDDLAGKTQIAIGKVKPADLNYFVDKQKELSDFLVSKITVDNSLSISDEVAFNKMVAELEAEIAQSEGQATILSAQLKQGDKSKHTNSSLRAINESYGKTQGNWGEIPSLTDKVDLTTYTKNTLQPLVENLVKTQKRGIEEFTPQEANEFLANVFSSNSTIRNQVQDDFEEAYPNMQYTDELGLKFYQEAQGKVLNLKDYNYAPQGFYNAGYTQDNKALRVTYNENTGDVTYDDPKDPKDQQRSVIVDPTDPNKKLELYNPSFTTKVDKDGKTVVIGGTALIYLSPEQKDENSKVIASNLKKESELAKAMKDFDLDFPKPKKKENAFGISYFNESDAEYNKRLKEWQSKKKEVQDRYIPDPLPNKIGTIKLDADKAREISFGKTGVKAEDLIRQGANTRGVKFQEIKKPKVEAMDRNSAKAQAGIKKYMEAHPKLTQAQAIQKLIDGGIIK